MSDLTEEDVKRIASQPGYSVAQEQPFKAMVDMSAIQKAMDELRNMNRPKKADG